MTPSFRPERRAVAGWALQAARAAGAAAVLHLVQLRLSQMQTSGTCCLGVTEAVLPLSARAGHAWMLMWCCQVSGTQILIETQLSQDLQRGSQT